MKQVLLMLVLISSLSITPSATAAELAPSGTPARKIQRGFLNIALSPIEVSNEIVKLKKAELALPSWTIGIIRGSCTMTARALVGAYEILTFPVSLPADYAPVINPEFAWDYLPSSETPAE